MIRSLRIRLNKSFFGLLKRALQSTAGQAILVEALEGRYETNLPPLSTGQPDLPYSDLLGLPTRPPPGRDRSPIFITGRFRSGSTLMWQIFRNLEGFTAYYEPFNERRWFCHADRGDRTDPTHLGVEDYWREYDGMEDLDAVFREGWAERRFFMDGQDWDGPMFEYLVELLQRAPQRPVLQFNRVDFRLAWLRRFFPGAKILHIFRHPRDQWLSSLGPRSDFPTDGALDDFDAFDGFYLLRWARDLKLQFPFLPIEGSDHPYRLFYYLWKLSYVSGIELADHSVSFEQLVREPQDQLELMLAALGVARKDTGIATALIQKPSIGRWTRYADHQWFAAHEAHCEANLEFFLGRKGILEVNSTAPKPSHSRR